MRICLVADMNSIHVRRWSAHFKKMGHEVSIVSLTRDHGSSADYDECVEVLPKQGAFHYARQIFPIRKAVKKLNPDICHGHYMTSGGFYASTSGAKHIVVSAWGSDLYFDSKNFLKRQAIKWAINHSDIVMGDSNHILNEVGHLSAKAETRKVIFGIDTGLFKPLPVKHDKFTFLSVRATGGVYNSPIIVKAFEKANLDAILMMQEPQADGFVVKDYVKSKPELDKKVVWYGRRSYAEMPGLYNSADVGISVPSWDSSSTAMNECMACGVPVIASEIPQNHEWVDGANGFFARIEVDDLARAMRETAVMRLAHYSFKAREKIVADGDFNTEMSKAERIYQEVFDGKK